MRYKRALGALIAVILVSWIACSSGASLEGTWVYDIARLGEFDVVAGAAEAERAAIIGELTKEAETLTLVITKDTMRLTAAGQTQEVPYRVIRQEGTIWTIESERGGTKNQSVMEVNGGSLVIRNAGSVMQVYRRK